MTSTRTAAPNSSDARVEDLVKSGKVRVAMYPPTYFKDAATGELSGWTIDIMHALADRLGVEGIPVECPTPPEAVACLRDGGSDLAFLGIDPVRGVHVDYTPPLIELDYTVLVPAGSSIRTMAELDRSDVRIAAVRNHASTLALERMLPNAKLVYADMLEPAFDLFRNGAADAFASVRELVLQGADELPGSRVLDGRYGANRIAIAVAKGQADRLAFVSAFVEEVKATGMLQAALDRIGWRGARVAPPAQPA